MNKNIAELFDVLFGQAPQLATATAGIGGAMPTPKAFKPANIALDADGGFDAGNIDVNDIETNIVNTASGDLGYVVNGMLRDPSGNTRPGDISANGAKKKKNLLQKIADFIADSFSSC